MSRITTHVLDTSVGKPVVGLSVTLNVRDNGTLREIARAMTDDEGRVRNFFPDQPLATIGVYQLCFETAAHFRATARAAFFERITLEFHVTDLTAHYHVPLLLSPFAFSTYRGS